MQLILHDVEEDRIVECPHCQWSGSSSQLRQGELLELSNITEVFCPACNKYIGFIQHEEKTGENSHP